MYYLDFIAKAGLAFSHTPILAGVLFLGLVSKKREIFVKTAYLLLFTMIYNLYLKSIWQVPLPPPLEGWAFPSGHMHSAFVFWGWLAVEFKKTWFYEFVFVILTLVGYGLIQQGYHYPSDVLASVGFGSLSITIYAMLNRTSFFKNQTARLGWFMLLLSAGVLFLLLPAPIRKPHVIKAFQMLCVFAISWTTYQFIIDKKKA